jgi:hypothetical protein
MFRNICKTPNAAVEWLELLRIRKDPASIFDLEAGYLDQDFSCVSSVSPSKSWDSTLEQTTRTYFRVLPTPSTTFLLDPVQYK